MELILSGWIGKVMYQKFNNCLIKLLFFMKVIYVNSPRAMKRLWKKAIEEEKKAKRMYFERKLEEAQEQSVIIEPNDAFFKIQSELVNLGWYYEEEFGNFVEFADSSYSLTYSPAIKLVNEKFNITLIPHKEGIEISRLEVRKNYQGQGYASLFIDNLLRFFIKIGVEEIYVLPAPAGIDVNPGSMANSSIALYGFYQRRDFQRLKDSKYWKLMSKNNIDIDRLDMEILTNHSGAIENSETSE